MIQFVLLGFPGPWKMQIILFSMILFIYILTLTGNMTIICAVKCDNRLHTPVYMLLDNFSFLEIRYVTCTVPNMLVNCFFQNQDHILFWLFFSILLLLFPGHNWMFLLLYHGFWSVPSHLPSTVLFLHHDWIAMCHSGVSLLSHWFPGTLNSYFLHFSTTLLWSQHHWSLSVWCGPTDGIILCPYTHHRTYIPFCELCHHHSHHAVHPWLLHHGAQSCASGSFFSWAAKGLLYLWIPLSCGFSVLWNHNGDVFNSYIR